MAAQSGVTSSATAEREASDSSRLAQEGIVAGVIGAATIAIWFLILDTIKGRPFHTPSVLGSVLFRPGGAPPSLENVPVSFEVVLVYTWVHGLVFCVIGGIAAWLLAVAERKPDLGFGIVLLFVVFEFGFLVAAMLFAETLLHALAWQEILVGNLLAAAAMGLYFWRRHPNLTIRP